jgi:hypothetical protein
LINTEQLAKPAVVDFSGLSRQKLSQEFLLKTTGFLENKKCLAIKDHKCPDADEDMRDAGTH